MTNSRAKGARGELELSNLLKQYGYSTRRGQQYCGSNGDADVVGLKLYEKHNCADCDIYDEVTDEMGEKQLKFKSEE